MKFMSPRLVCLLQLMTGYITVADAAEGRRFVPVTPCRLVDTREASLGAFGAPFLAGGSARSFAVPARTACGIPATAAAYALNVTVVPKGTLGYLTLFPTGGSQPLVSTLNSPDGRIKANAAIVPAGTGGAISVYVTNATEVVIDINGYFVDPVANSQALAFYPLAPCRVLDSRNPNGPLGGPVLGGGIARSVPVLSSNCGVPANALAYSINATVVPEGPLGYLTLWPVGQGQPFVSTLNAPTGTIVANAAIVPSGTNGAINAFATNQTHLVVDINGYFAAPGAANAQDFYSVAPCRLLDTREALGEFGGPILAGGVARSYRFPLTNCSVPAVAKAFSLNSTVVPLSSLGYLTLWPFGSAQPFVSTLNALDGAITSNAAIVPAGTAGGVASYVTNQTHLILDINGYFATEGQGQSKIAGEWYYRDSGGILEYSLGSNGTYTAIKQLTAAGYPKIVIRIKGQYTVRGSSIELTPSEVDANGSPGPLISESGRYDERTDKLVLRQANSSSDIVYSRK